MENRADLYPILVALVIIIADATKSPHRVTRALKWPEVE
jgi:hypothetical protein